ncbi:MAG: hypothetical protein ACREOI_17640 [bacterium]
MDETHRNQYTKWQWAVAVAGNNVPVQLPLLLFIKVAVGSSSGRE